MLKYSGSCLCGKITFEIAGEFRAFFLCHCSRCRKETGSAHAANLFSETAKLCWISGKDQVHVFYLPGTRFMKSFCKACGSALPTVRESGGLVVPAGSLDCDVNFSPDGHIFMGSKANWDSNFEVLPKFETLPQKLRK